MKKIESNGKVKPSPNSNNASQANVFDNPNYSTSPRKVNHSHHTNNNVIKLLIILTILI